MICSSPSGLSTNSAGSGNGWSASRLLQAGQPRQGTYEGSRRRAHDMRILLKLSCTDRARAPSLIHCAGCFTSRVSASPALARMFKAGTYAAWQAVIRRCFWSIQSTTTQHLDPFYMQVWQPEWGAGAVSCLTDTASSAGG